MAVFTPNTPITTRVPEVAVENKLAPGRYRFQLVVEDEQGNLSQPAIQVVTVIRPLVPVESSGGTGVLPMPAPAPVLPRDVPGSPSRSSRAGRQRAARPPAGSPAGAGR